MKKNNLFYWIFLWVAVTALPAAGCGYHFQKAGEPVGITISGLAIPLMESRSSDLGFESAFTKTIREEFIRHADIPLVTRDEASMVLIGKVREIKTVPLTYEVTEKQTAGTTTYYPVTDSRRLFIRLDAQLLERSTGKIIWNEVKMMERAPYAVTDDPLTNRYNKRNAVREIARKFADRLYLKTVERF